MLSGIDSIVLKKKIGNRYEFISSGSLPLSFADLDGMESLKRHPYLEVRDFGGSFYLTGSLGYEGVLDIFIFKKIDEQFYKGSYLSERPAVFFVSLSDLYSGRLIGEDIYDFLQSSGLPDVPYKEAFNLSLNEGDFNASFRKLGKIRKGKDEEDFFLILLISNEPYLSILSRIYKTLFTVSFIVSFFAIGLSFYFSRNITHPIRRLTYAMEGIRRGNYNVKIDYKSGNEVGILFQGFNEMALQIDQNKKSMEHFIHEITFLKDYNEKIIYSLRAGILVIDSDLYIEKVNSFFLEFFSKDEADILSKSIIETSIEIIDKSLVIKISELISGKIDSWTIIKRTESLVCEIKLYPLFITENMEERKCVLEIDDISKKVELDEKIFQAEKLSSLSMLSAGVSHEINNPLSSILTNVQNLIAEDNDEETLTALNWIEQETRRIAKIVNDLLNFSASEQGCSGGSEVDTTINDVLKLINYGLEMEGRIEIFSDFQEGLPLVVVSNSELKQVIINLVQNSIYAIEGEGEIHIKVRLRKLKKMIRIQISDTGVGMNEETMLHVFDPFFTTRTNGKGTGLGMSIVYGIINKNSGSIDVKSSEGIGTTISLEIPVL